MAAPLNFSKQRNEAFGEHTDETDRRLYRNEDDYSPSSAMDGVVTNQPSSVIDQCSAAGRMNDSTESEPDAPNGADENENVEID